MPLVAVTKGNSLVWHRYYRFFVQDSIRFDRYIQAVGQVRYFPVRISGRLPDQSMIVAQNRPYKKVKVRPGHGDCVACKLAWKFKKPSVMGSSRSRCDCPSGFQFFCLLLGAQHVPLLLKYYMYYKMINSWIQRLSTPKLGLQLLFHL